MLEQAGPAIGEGPGARIIWHDSILAQWVCGEFKEGCEIFFNVVLEKTHAVPAGKQGRAERYQY